MPQCLYCNGTQGQHEIDCPSRNPKIQKIINVKDKRIAELEMTLKTQSLAHHHEVQAQTLPLQERIAELETENKRLRECLERITEQQ